MKQRWLSLLFALGALLLFYVLFIGSPTGLNDQVARPTASSTDANGYAGARAWLVQQGVAVRSLRERYTALGSQNLAPAGNLLLVTLPGVERFQSEEFASLEQWVRAGNTLVVLAALVDTPAWAVGRTSAVLAETESLSSLEFESPDVRDSRVTSNDGIDIAMRSNGSHPLTSGDRSLLVRSTAPPRLWFLRTPNDSFALALASEEQTHEGVLFIRLLGNGRIVVSTAASLFANDTIGRADNARLLANLVANDVGPAGTVLFDDLRQGVAASYDTVQFWRDARLHWTFAVVVCAWLLWVIGGTRLVVPRRTDAAPSPAALIAAAGGMLSARLRPAVAAREMYAQFLQRTAAGSGIVQPLTDERSTEVWNWLERQRSVSQHDRAQLKDWFRATQSGQRVPLVKLHNLFLRIDRQLAK
ncbi:MAG: DUF4350 domain-containing protein, partial [Pseudomonadales bacterium]|nr:DUF4350 domain-containing protein [Pseudomonadales bacterium]